jgi:hypothetical protein
LLSTFPRNRPGNAADAAAEAAWREATVDSGAVGALGAVDASVDPAAAEKLKDIRADGAARPIGTTLALPSSGAAAAVLRAHEAFYDALARGDEDAMRAAWRPAASLVASNAGALDSGVGFLIGKGARLDGWETVLRPDRRPEGLKLSDVDVTVERERRDGDRLGDGGQRRDAARDADLREGEEDHGGRRGRGLDPAVALHDPVREGHGGEDRAAVRRARVRRGSGQGGGERQDGGVT